MGLYYYTTSDTSAGALTPIMGRAGVDDGYVASPCRGCEHETKDKNTCVGQPGCRIRSYREPVSSADGTKTEDRTECAFPGCNATSQIKQYCKKHYFVTYDRKARGWSQDRLHKPLNSSDLPSSNAKMTEADVREIRKLHPGMTYKQIGEKYGIHKETVKNIVKHKTWKNVKD